MNEDRRPGIKGRGAADNPQGRFDKLERSREPEQEMEGAEATEPPRPRTVVTLQQARSIITRNQSPDIPFTQSINPYQGCEHGCIYCYARPSHAYVGLSPGLDFETKLFAKVNAAQLLREELSRPGYQCEVISLGANTDPYQPIEREQRLTRSILEVLWEFRHPVGIVTKNSLVERDLDLLEPMAGEGLAHVYLSIGTLDGDIARTLEPRTAAPYRRVEAIRRLSERGIPCGVLVAPIIPFLNDKDLEASLAACREAGATMADYVIVRLPWEVKELFKDWLERHYPLKAAHVMARIREMRGGRENDPEFGSRMTGEGAFAQLIRRRFDVACRQLGFNRGGHTLDASRFRRPPSPQMTLF
jgi:DNA repair photolyase